VCFEAPVQYDVVVAGQKVAGAAQRRLRRGLLHQGSVLLPSAAPMNDALRAGFERQLGAVFEQFEPPAPLMALAGKLCQEKYATRAWTERFRA
jgi:lipoate-protein ligase A